MKCDFYKIISIAGLILLFTAFVFAQTERENGVKLYQQGDYKGAIKSFKQAANKDSSDADALYYLGSSYLNIGKTKEARKSFAALVKLKSEDSRGYIGLAFVQLADNKTYPAQKSAEKALELNGKSFEAHYLLGVINFRNGSYNGAYQRAEKVIEINANYADAYLLKSEALVSSFGQTSGTIVKSPKERVELLKEAAAAMEKYQSLAVNDDKERTARRERLEALKFFADYYEKPENLPGGTLEPNSYRQENYTRIKILYQPKPGYTDAARKAGISGTVRLLVGFPADGQVKHILVMRGIVRDLNEQAIKAAQKIVYEPAVKDGKPISSVATIEYSFAIY